MSSGTAQIVREGQDQVSLECLQNTLDETQETIRAYDTKAEVLAIILTLVVGVVNFTLVSEGCKAHCWIKVASIVSIFVGIATLFAAGMVLYPRKNFLKDIETGAEKPKGTYFVSLGVDSPFRNLDDFLRQVEETDWKREVAYEVLKTSHIRDNKHFWFHIAIRGAAITLLGILVLLIGVAYYG